MTKFLRPVSKQYPFDEVVSEIVAQLEALGWNAPCMKVGFKNYGGGQLDRIDEIVGGDFKLVFGRNQGDIPHRRDLDLGAVNIVWILKKQLMVTHLEAITLWVYTGQNWKQHKQWFFNGPKMPLLTRINKGSRLFLEYKGSNKTDTYKAIPNLKQRPKYLTANTDLGAEYTPKGDEPWYYEVDTVLLEFADWLHKNVLEPLRKIPKIVIPVYDRSEEWDTYIKRVFELAGIPEIEGDDNARIVLTNKEIANEMGGDPARFAAVLTRVARMDCDLSQKRRILSSEAESR
jgi:hypothetical protein